MLEMLTLINIRPLLLSLSIWWCVYSRSMHVRMWLCQSVISLNSYIYISSSLHCSLYTVTCSNIIRD